MDSVVHLTAPDQRHPKIGWREMRKQDRRQAIIEAARRSFFEDGYAATSMSGLLATVGGSKTTLWRYFPSKEQLFAAVIEDTTSAFSKTPQNELVDGPGVEETLVAFCRSLMTRMYEPEGSGLWRLIVAEGLRFPEVGRIFYETAVQPGEQKLADYFRKQIDEGRLKDEDPEKMAQFLIGLCNGQYNLRLCGIISPDVKQLNQDAESFAQYFLRLFGTNQNAIKRFARIFSR